MMGRQLHWACVEHDDPTECPDSLVARLPDGQFGLRVHDGGSSIIPIKVCPWCGRPPELLRQPERVHGGGDQPPPVDARMSKHQPLGGATTDDEARALAVLLARWATRELDQFDHGKVETPGGPAYVQVATEKAPGTAEEVHTTIWPLPVRLRWASSEPT
jgi:hypothetical protein